jgi:hypothetical protein
MELVDKNMGRPYSGYDKREAEKLLASANSPLTNLEVEGVGAGGELMLNMPVKAGDHILMLKSPYAIIHRFNSQNL